VCEGKGPEGSDRIKLELVDQAAATVDNRLTMVSDGDGVTVCRSPAGSRDVMVTWLDHIHGRVGRWAGGCF